MTENHRFVWPNYLPNIGVRVLTNSLTKSDCNRYITSHRDSKVESARSMLALASDCTDLLRVSQDSARYRVPSGTPSVFMQAINNATLIKLITWRMDLSVLLTCLRLGGVKGI